MTARKISLDVDALRVESFDTAERDADARGTVRAHASLGGFSDCQTQCGACPSGPYPCERSYAVTDGIAVCPCADGTTRCVE